MLSWPFKMYILAFPDMSGADMACLSSFVWERLKRLHYGGALWGLSLMFDPMVLCCFWVSCGEIPAAFIPEIVALKWSLSGCLKTFTVLKLSLFWIRGFKWKRERKRAQVNADLWGSRWPLTSVFETSCCFFGTSRGAWLRKSECV